MVDVTAIASAIGSIQSARDIAKTAIGLRDAAVLQAKVSELTDAILAAQASALDAQSEQFALVQRVRDLEEKLVELETWEAEKQRYQLQDFGGGTFAYLLKEDMSGGEPPHRICAACYQKRHKSILQSDGQNYSGQDLYDCPECGTSFRFGKRRPFEPVDDGGSFLSS